MTRFLKNAVSLMLVTALLYCCTGNPEAKKAKSLSLDEKAKNTFKNTVMVFSGSMFLSFSKAFKDQAEVFANAFDAELDNEAIIELDEKIGGLGEETMQGLEEMMSQMDAAFDDLADNNLSIYKKMFLADIMKEGVAITEKYELPNGFRPLSQDLSKEEIKRYILKVTTDAEDQEDPIMKTYMELFDWFQRVSDELNNDPEIQNYLRNLRK